MDAATYCYRLAGTRLCEMFGSELRGTNLLDGWPAADRAALANDLALTCERGAAIHLVLEAVADGERRVQLEATFLPLMHAEGAIGRVIGAMSAMASPHWLGHDPLRARRLISHELIWPDGRPNARAGLDAATAAARHRRRAPSQLPRARRRPQGRLNAGLASGQSGGKAATGGRKTRRRAMAKPIPNGVTV